MIEAITSSRDHTNQAVRRNVESSLRRRVLAFDRANGEAAERIGLSNRTVNHWHHGWECDRLTPKAKGPKPDRLPRPVRQAILEVLTERGIRISVRELERHFPQVGFRQLQAFKERFIRAYFRRNSLLRKQLGWDRAGAVWAVDFTEAPHWIDGSLKHILAVRDLGSGMQLAATPVADMTAETTREVVQSLFFTHGAPLVMKSDNGSAFVSQDFQELLARWSVAPLLSPPHYPQYNGACEAGIGSIKTNAHQLSLRRGGFGAWTSDDVEGARRLVNRKLNRATTPQQIWAARRPIVFHERVEFAQTVDRFAKSIASEYAGSDPKFENLLRSDASVTRLAMQKALVELRILNITRRRIPQPKTSAKVAKFS